ncbi:S8 family serine peptidase [Parapusillimonas granuli]|uniref:S8 family serine peptidase n=1 Tax=Parapusillimonas granuli TaxID=380911 RepID=A0A853FZZ3_9BURK|nr:S8 family serine peptidase [Parapusillimonas granuli]MBB5214107.1 subtilisin family serine protease [Parapusillimonas granuli]NYT50528.1 S8 family serine peptidase [Parapusillimonas granuli]
MSSLNVIRLPLISALALALAACDGSGGSGTPIPDVACAETGPYACRTGTTEPLYTFQWALNYKDSYFQDYPSVFGGGLDLNVEPVHRQGIKGQGVRVMVVDTGTDLHTEDLAPNADPSLSWNLVTDMPDPYPTQSAIDDGSAHGTAVAGIIAAAQNGKGVMGIAPLAKVGGVNFLENPSVGAWAASMGGATWSSGADIFNASLGLVTAFALPYDSDEDTYTPVVRAMKKLRDGKGAVFLKAAGNDFDSRLCGHDFGYYDCSNPANDPMGPREPNAITVAAINAFGEASSYSSAGSVIWVSGMGGEFGESGTYGEVGTRDYSGPTIFSTDLRGCAVGFSSKTAHTPFLRGESHHNGIPDNRDCDYAYMNGTSAATPTVAGVVALVLSANPDLGWRDVRDILRMSARKVDAGYVSASPHRLGLFPYGARMDLATNKLSTHPGGKDDIRPGSTAVPIDLGWQKNGAGHEHSNWYGFGVPDAARAVELAREYKRDPRLSRLQDVQIPEFETVGAWYQGDGYAEGLEEQDVTSAQSMAFPYQRVTLLGTLQSPAQVVDSFQVRLSGTDVCLGALGIAVRSPAGTVSLLKLPNDAFRSKEVVDFNDYALNSVAFYGEEAQGEWQIYLMAANPDLPLEFAVKQPDGSYMPGFSQSCFGAKSRPTEYFLETEARIIAQ